MENFAISTLSLLSLTAIAVFSFVISKKIKFPYTLFLVFVGTILHFASFIPFFEFLSQFRLTPEILFYVFLPTLLFEAAYNIKINKLLENIRAISLLAILGLLISTFIIGFGLHYALLFFGIEVPVLVTLLFGAIISATDPVAVIALFKEYSAPKRLILLFEGESLFNDGTAVAMFLVILSLIESGKHFSFSTITEAALIFSSMIVLGVLLGLFFGIIFSKAMGWAKNDNLQITLALLSAHFSFLVSEIITEHLHIPISAIITTVVTSIIIGNYGRYKLNPSVEKYMDKFWDYFAFLANSLVFILLGMLIADIDISNKTFLIATALAIVIVILARAISVYSSLSLLKLQKKEKLVPKSWQHLLSWGSLRGALAITMVLLIPDDLSLAAWNYEFSIKEFVMALTIGSIYFALFVKGLSISYLIKKLKISEIRPSEKMEYLEGKALAYQELKKALQEQKDSGELSKEQFEKIEKWVNRKIKESSEAVSRYANENIKELEKSLAMFAIGIEKERLQELYENKEVSERAYKKFLNKLDAQENHILYGQDETKSFDEIQERDLVESFLNFLNKITSYNKKENFKKKDRYYYYKALIDTAKKVVKELKKLKDEKHILQNSETLDKFINKYKRYAEQAQQKLEKLLQENPDLVKDNSKHCASKILLEEKKELDKICDKQFIDKRIENIVQHEIEDELSEVLEEKSKNA